MKKNQDEVEIFSVNEWTKKHLEKKMQGADNFNKF